jgi:hypothetical protein
MEADMTWSRAVVMRACVVTLLIASPVAAAADAREPSHVRTDNQRIQEVIRYALARSASFEDLIATLGQLDRVVYLGNARGTGVRGVGRPAARRGEGEAARQASVVRREPHTGMERSRRYRPSS